MKKIEKTEELELPNISGRPYHHLGYGDKRGRWLEMATIAEKVNEIIINQNLIIDRLNQEVSQPEENLSWGDTELVFEKCDKNLLESIFGEDKRDEEDKKLDQRIIESHENNTEEWETMFDNLFYSSPSDLCVDKEELKALIRQLLSERSFSKEELETIKQIIDTHDGHKVGCEALGDILEKADRLLSLEK